MHTICNLRQRSRLHGGGVSAATLPNAAAATAAADWFQHLRCRPSTMMARLMDPEQAWLAETLDYELLRDTMPAISPRQQPPEEDNASQRFL